MNTSLFRTVVRSSVMAVVGAGTCVLGQSFAGLKPRLKRLLVNPPAALNPAVVRIGKIVACLILGATMLPQSAQSAPSYAAQALSYNPVGFWQLTETGDPSSGTVVANDSSGHGHNGLYGTTSQNGFSGILSPQPPTFPGFTNGQTALQTAGADVNSPVSIPFLNLNTNAVTITMWINPNNVQAASAGLLMNRNGADTAGFGFGTSGTADLSGMPALGYTWNTNAQATWGFNSGLHPALNTWSFVALVVQSNSATIYMCYIDGAGQTNILSSVNAIAHTPEAFSSGNIWLGSDVTAGGGGPDGTRVFSGVISDAAVYNQSLTSDQILALFASGLGVAGFPPSITTQPQSQYTLAGSKAQLKATGINGTAPITYQWKLNGTNVNLLADAANFTGATSNILTVVSAAAADAGSYQLFLTNLVGFAVSTNATLTIQATNLVGEWFGPTAGTNLSDVSGYSLATNHGAYFVGAGSFVFTNDVPTNKPGQSVFLYNGDTGFAISNSSTLDVNYDNTFDNRINNAITVTCWAKGWPGNWNPFVSKYGETTPSPSGGWQLRADAANHPTWTLRGAGGTTNGVAQGTADGGNPEDMAASSLTYGNDGVWHFYAGTYDASTGLRRLYVDGNYVATETNTSAYLLASVEHLCIGARDADGSTIANFFTGQLYDARVYNYALNQAALDGLYGQIPASVASQPRSVSTFTNSAVKFTVNGAGTPPLSYQWYLNGTNVSLLADAANFTGATSNVLTILNATGVDVGAYSVTVSNFLGGAISTNAMLALVPKLLLGNWLNGASSLADVSGYQAPGTHDGYDLANAGGSYSFTNDVPPYKTGSSIALVNDGIGIMNSSTADGAYTNTFDDTINNAMTVAFWARGYPGQWNPWVSKYGDSGVAPTAGWQLRDGGNSSNPAWTVRGAGGTVTQGTAVFGNSEDMRGTIAANDGQWHHYAGTFNAASGERILYIDGVPSGVETNNHIYTLAADSHVCIGARDQHGALASFFTGSIYDVRVYNYNLSSNEVRLLMGLPDPAITVQPPQAVTAYVGLSAQISAKVTGTGPITNQWQLNGTDLVDGFFGGSLISGAHSNVLTINYVTTNVQGVYHLNISNPIGAIVSSNSTLTVVTPTAPPATNLVGAWLTGTPDLVDRSGYSPAGTHDGYGVTGVSTPSSNYTFTNDAPPRLTGQALSFASGTTGIAISNSSTLDTSYTNTFDDTLTNAMTVALWAKGWPSGQWNPWVSKYGEGGQGWQLRRNGGTTVSTWTIRGTGGTEDMAATIGSNDGKWHHYAGTFDATTGVRNLYVDGVLAATQSGQLPYALAAASHLAFGARDSGGNNFGNYFGGELYGIRLYNVALTPAQINYLVQPQLPIFTSSLIHNGNQFVLNWTGGSLQQATNVLGPWVPTGATTPYTNVLSTNANMFFRLSNP